MAVRQNGSARQIEVCGFLAANDYTRLPRRLGVHLAPTQLS
jgi:hypothetical protein